MKENWLKWNIDSESDIKTRWYLNKFEDDKARGLGFFIHVVSLLYQTQDGWLDLDKVFLETTKEYLGMNWEEHDIRQALAWLVEAKLFVASDKKFASIRGLRDIEERKLISEKRKASGHKGGKISGTSRQSGSKTKQVLNNVNQIRLDKIRLDQNILEVETHAPKEVLEKKQSQEEIRGTITESLVSAKLGKELDAITAQEASQPIEAPSLKLKNGTALNVGHNFKPLTDDITSNQMYVSLGRRPLEKYPEIWITPLELKQVLDTAFDKKVEAKEIFAQVSTFVKDKIQAGEPLHRIKAVPALLGWGLQEALNIQTAEIRRDNQKNYKNGKPEQANPYKNFKVIS